MTRVQIALKVLEAGGYFRSQLEGQYRGSEKFVYRLRRADGSVVPGIGFKTWEYLGRVGKLTRRECAKSTVWPTEWKLWTAEAEWTADREPLAQPLVQIEE
jgi:hypothetical protein